MRHVATNIYTQQQNELYSHINVHNFIQRSGIKINVNIKLRL